MYGRNFPGAPQGFTPNYPAMPPVRPPQQQPAMQQQQPQHYSNYPESRLRGGPRNLKEEEAYQRPAAIITEKDLKGFDEILQNETQDGWAATHGEIDYE